ncbi:F-box/LRR-repeat protein 2 [Gryllus bimaculatus]|nr:F-box/LRR-repeat protein 2 [Gryllus bimaculatus]
MEVLARAPCAERRDGRVSLASRTQTLVMKMGRSTIAMVYRRANECSNEDSKIFLKASITIEKVDQLQIVNGFENMIQLYLLNVSYLDPVSRYLVSVKRYDASTTYWTRQTRDSPTPNTRWLHLPNAFGVEPNAPLAAAAENGMALAATPPPPPPDDSRSRGNRWRRRRPVRSDAQTLQDHGKRGGPRRRLRDPNIASPLTFDQLLCHTIGSLNVTTVGAIRLDATVTVAIRQRIHNMDSFEDHGNIQNLPDEVLLEIFQYMSLEELVTCIQNVSLRWRNVSQHSVRLWKNKIYKPVSRVTDEEIIATLKKMPQLRTFVFNPDCLKLDEIINVLCSHCKHLQTLVCDGFGVSTSHLQKMVNSLHDLEWFQLSQCHIIDHISLSLLSQFKKLRKLTCVNVGPASTFIRANNEVFQSLEHIEIIAYCSCDRGGIHEDQINKEILTKMFQYCPFPKLKKLDLSNCLNISVHTLRAMHKSCPGVQELHFSHCVHFDDECSLVLTQFPELLSLDLSCCNGVSDEGLSYLARCPKLEMLDLSWRMTVGGLYSDEVTSFEWNLTCEEQFPFSPSSISISDSVSETEAIAASPETSWSASVHSREGQLPYRVFPQLDIADCQTQHNDITRTKNRPWCDYTVKKKAQHLIFIQRTDIERPTDYVRLLDLLAYSIVPSKYLWKKLKKPVTPRRDYVPDMHRSDRYKDTVVTVKPHIKMSQLVTDMN